MKKLLLLLSVVLAGCGGGGGGSEVADTVDRLPISTQVKPIETINFATTACSVSNTKVLPVLIAETTVEQIPYFFATAFPRIVFKSSRIKRTVSLLTTFFLVFLACSVIVTHLQFSGQ